MALHDQSKNRDEILATAGYIFDHRRQFLEVLELRADSIALAYQQYKSDAPQMHSYLEDGWRPKMPEAVWQQATSLLVGREGVEITDLTGEEVHETWIAFRRKVAERILAANEKEIEIARCPECQRVLDTPSSMGCVVCGHDWHPRFTDIFLREASADVVYETLRRLGASPQSHIPGEQTWVVSAADGESVVFNVIEDFSRYSIELYVSVLEELMPTFDELGVEPKVYLIVGRGPEAEEVAQGLIREVLAVHSGIARDQRITYR